jgi:hypothetical protein
MRHTSTILIVDDEVGDRKTLEGLLSNVLAAQATAAHFLDMSQQLQRKHIRNEFNISQKEIFRYQRQ